MHVYCTQSRIGGSKNRSMPKWPQPNMAETDCDIHCPTVGHKHWMFSPQLADVVDQFAQFPFGRTRDSILIDIDCMCWAGKNGNAIIFIMNL